MTSTCTLLTKHSFSGPFTEGNLLRLYFYSTTILIIRTINLRSPTIEYYKKRGFKIPNQNKYYIWENNLSGISPHRFFSNIKRTWFPFNNELSVKIKLHPSLMRIWNTVNKVSAALKKITAWIQKFNTCPPLHLVFNMTLNFFFLPPPLFNRAMPRDKALYLTWKYFGNASLLFTEECRKVCSSWIALCSQGSSAFI